jgi:hypothetical protein
VSTSPTRYWREAVLLLVLVAPLLVLLAGNPIPQDARLTHYADNRAFLGIPNFFDVASNLAFLLVGLAGLFTGAARNGVSRSWLVAFLGTALVCFGSGYYHWAPDNERLVWDRLPMTLAFMGLFAALLSEHLGARIERVLLAPALIAGIASVLWWHYTNDLRFYIWVQLAPFLAILVVLFAFPGRYTHRAYLLHGLALYALAKISEVYDGEIYSLTARSLSGHTLKHLLAAGAVLMVYLMLLRRTPLPGHPVRGRDGEFASEPGALRR